jgi:hypothetical protein
MSFGVNDEFRAGLRDIEYVDRAVINNVFPPDVSNKILNFVHRRSWQFTYGVKFNRELNGVGLDAQHRKPKRKWHDRVIVSRRRERLLIGLGICRTMICRRAQLTDQMLRRPDTSTSRRTR